MQREDYRRFKFKIVLKNTADRRKSMLPIGGTHQLVAQYQVITSEIISI